MERVMQPERIKLDALKLKLEALKKSKEYTKSLELVHEALKEYPNSRRLHAWLGYTYKLLEDFDKAEHFYLKAKSLPYDEYFSNKEIDQVLASIYMSIGNSYISKKESLKAIEYIKKAIQMDKNLSYAYLLLGWMYYELNDYELSLDYLNTSIENYSLRPDKKIPSDCYLYRSYTLSKLDKYEEAFDDAIKAEELFKEGDNLSDINYWLDLCSSVIDFRYAFKGDEYIENGKIEEAKGILDKGIKKIRRAIVCNTVLADLYDLTGEPSKSLECINRANDNLTMHSITSAHISKEDLSNLYSIVCMGKGQALSSLKRYEEAREAFRESIKHAPKDQDMSEVYEDLKDLEWR